MNRGSSNQKQKIPSLLFANQQGEIIDYDGLLMAGASGEDFTCPEPETLIPLPEGSELFVLPARLPVGIEPKSGEPALLDQNPYKPGEEILAVAAFMAPAHTAIYTTAYQKKQNAPLLPLFAYTAVGWMNDKFYVAGFRSDKDIRQDPCQFDQETIEPKTRKKLAGFPENRLIQHLGKCCLTYGCPAARNFFSGRWEAPLPCSPVCNAACLGCISLQPSGCCPSTQDRIKFIPSPAELAEVAINHLETAPRPVVSFGQGCEGEPLLQADTMVAAIRKIRGKTKKGTVNLNSNGSLPEAVTKLAQSGLDSIRISVNSSQQIYHHRYYKPKGFSLADVRRSMEIMRNFNRHVSLNYFILPGFTDDPAEFQALSELIETEKPDLIQLRNLNIDPEFYLKSIDFQPTGPAMGMLNWYKTLSQNFPNLTLGYFNPFLGE